MARLELASQVAWKGLFMLSVMLYHGLVMHDESLSFLKIDLKMVLMNAAALPFSIVIIMYHGSGT